MKKLLLVLLFMLAGCNSEFSNADLLVNQERGDLLVSALNQYYNEHALYPASLAELTPTYLSELPENTRGNPFFYKTHEFHGYQLCLDTQSRPNYAGCCYYPIVGDWDCTDGDWHEY